MRGTRAKAIRRQAFKLTQASGFTGGYKARPDVEKVEQADGTIKRLIGKIKNALKPKDKVFAVTGQIVNPRARTYRRMKRAWTRHEVAR